MIAMQRLLTAEMVAYKLGFHDLKDPGKKAKKWCSINQVPFIDLGPGRGNGLRWFDHDVDATLLSLRKDPNIINNPAQIKPNRPPLPSGLFSGSPKNIMKILGLNDKMH